MKMLNLRVIQWCFQLLGNRFPCVKLQQEPPAAAAIIKLVNSDGLVKIYHTPIHVSELMKEFPKHLVCRSDSLYIGQRIPALSEDDQLQLGNNYFLFPQHCFQSALSFVTVASFAANSDLSKQQPFSPSSSSSSPSFSRQSVSDSMDAKRALIKKMDTCQPFHIQKTQSGCLRIRVSDEFVISQLIERRRLIKGKGKGTETETEEDDDHHRNKTGRVCSTPQLHKDYEQLVGSSRLIWKPKLDTIRETAEKRKLNFSSSFGMMNTRNNIVVKSSSSSSSNGLSSSSSFKGLISSHRTGKHNSTLKSSSSQHHNQFASSPKPSKSKSKSKNKKTKKISIKIKIDVKSRK